ncbi:MAG: phosphodiesterase, family [Symbiobacteriaceae bacterium]|nr:phosphodiesterase, family [Symbiobacteriaceae bacterium]
MEAIPTKIGVISDTHIPKKAPALPTSALEAFRGADLILHAGDLVVPDVLAELQRIAPVVAVAGNNDPPELVEQLGFARVVELAGYRIGLAHGHIGKGKSTVERALSHFQDVNCVVFGHSHIPYRQMHGATVAFNPGATVGGIRARRGSYGIIFVESDGLRAEIFEI